MKSFSSKKTRTNIPPPTADVLKDIPTLQPFQYKPLPDRFTHPKKKSLGDKKEKK